MWLADAATAQWHTAYSLCSPPYLDAGHGVVKVGFASPKPPLAVHVRRIPWEGVDYPIGFVSVTLGVESWHGFTFRMKKHQTRVVPRGPPTAICDDVEGRWGTLCSHFGMPTDARELPVPFHPWSANCEHWAQFVFQLTTASEEDLQHITPLFLCEHCAAFVLLGGMDVLVQPHRVGVWGLIGLALLLYTLPSSEFVFFPVIQKITSTPYKCTNQ